MTAVPTLCSFALAARNTMSYHLTWLIVSLCHLQQHVLWLLFLHVLCSFARTWHIIWLNLKIGQILIGRIAATGPWLGGSLLQQSINFSKRRKRCRVCRYHSGIYTAGRLNPCSWTAEQKDSEKNRNKLVTVGPHFCRQTPCSRSIHWYPYPVRRKAVSDRFCTQLDKNSAYALTVIIRLCTIAGVSQNPQKC
jgi:hypothetical protein